MPTRPQTERRAGRAGGSETWEDLYRDTEVEKLPWFLPRLVGARRSLELMLTNRLLKAPEALEWGIVNQVVADDAVLETALELAGQLAQGPTGAFGVTKRLVLASGSTSLETQMEAEGDAIAASSGTPDGQEGIAAFLEKRPPKFG